ncbi:methyltransferase domain-containing protein [Marichromatium gracile]|uniref:SAM-dependent methyltransferase n=1 Tax=Marichromatium gracile TaxID=1048 RepID=UPI001F33510A|nr:methyltransferase domain-containing protein [Marichromatium gracile]MCF1183146.1 methyltransferase domain-containing protein [Marichromatium gracile]
MTRNPPRRALALLDWIYNPLRRLPVSAVYDLLGTDSPAAGGHYLNLGYWAEADELDAACRALVDLVGARAGMAPGKRVLDLGFGFGEQDLQWMRTLGPESIVGLNVTGSQVALARERVAAAGESARIDLRQGSATEPGLEPGSFDIVVALECAFHFRTRERFFAEALRLLRPGGRLVLADILPLAPAEGWSRRLAQRWSWREVATKFAIPAENAYPRAEYAERLRACGFTGVEVESIRDRVYAPLHAYLRANPERLSTLPPALRTAVRFGLWLEPDTVFAGLDYVLASAERPATDQ